MTTSRSVKVEARAGGIMAVSFQAMASPCEILFHTADAALAARTGRAAADEVWRIEAKYSRYRPDSVIGRINASAGHPFSVDAETAGLLDFAQNCYQLSQGMFDVTSGVLRQAWRFDGSDDVPDPALVERICQRVGFGRLDWQSPVLTMLPGMEMDFGGLGKEYAADRALGMVDAMAGVPALVNLGGDLCCNRPPPDGSWQVGVERPDRERMPARVLELTGGALATSGDTHRFLLKDGIRYSHILNPQTGWPVRGGPRSVTVAALSCVEAGMLATFALLQGDQAEVFLQQQGVPFWCLW